MIFKILLPKSLKKLVVFEKIFEKFEKMVKGSKNGKKLQKIEFFSSKFEFSVIFRPFTPLLKFFKYFFHKLLTFMKILIPRF